jgi:hypothetical protein
MIKHPCLGRGLAVAGAAAAALLAAAAHGESVSLELPVSGLKLTVDLPAAAGTWAAAERADASGRVDLLSRQPKLEIALALTPAGVACGGGLDRLTKRAGLTLLDRPGYLGGAWGPKATEEVAFDSGTTIHVACADSAGRALIAAVAYAGDPAELGKPGDAVGALLTAAADAAAASPTAAAFAPPAGPLQPPTGSLIARIRLMADPGSASAAMASKSGTFTLPSGASVLTKLNDKLSSKTAKENQEITATVTQDVVLDDAVLIRKGTLVKGHIAKASSSSLGGQGGSVDFSVDSTTAVDGQRVPLRYEAKKEGKNTRGISLTGYFTGWGLLTKGKDYELPAGTPLEARTTAPVTITVDAAAH